MLNIVPYTMIRQGPKFDVRLSNGQRQKRNDQ